MAAIVGLFQSAEDADRAVDALKAAGYSSDDIEVLAREKTLGEKLKTAKSSVTAGGVLGGLAGLLIGTGAILVPGLGPVLAAGTLGPALAGLAAGVGIGAAAGGIIGILTKRGIPEEEAHLYAEAVKRGGVLVMVSPNAGREDVARTILNNAGAIDQGKAKSQWEAKGWHRFDEDGNPDSYDALLYDDLPGEH